MTQQPTWHKRYDRWRNNAVVRNVMIGLSLGGALLAWSPLTSDIIELALALLLIVALGVLGLLDERDDRRSERGARARKQH